MKTCTSFQEAQGVPGVVHVHRVSDTEWKAYEPGDELPPPPPPNLAAEYTARLEEMYDQKAQQRHYDNRYTCALRAGYASAFQAEGTAFAQWMDACNAHAYTVMATVMAGQRAIPTWEELAAELPEAPW